MRPMPTPLVVFLAILLAPLAAKAEVVDRVEPYAIAGRTGIDLYRSIGERGPKAANGRAIATTRFRLTWTRRYERRGDACTLAVAKPHLVITHILPKPAEALPAATRRLWDDFIAGIAAHEKVHGEIIKEMVGKIEAMSVGLTVPDDPQCRKIRTELTRRLAALSAEQRQKSREFDAAEMSRGGNVERLILTLVNEGRLPPPQPTE